MKPLPIIRVGLVQHAGDLDVEAVVVRRLRRCVELEVLRNRLDVRAERGEERGVRKLGGEHGAGKQDHREGGHLRLLECEQVVQGLSSADQA